MPQTSDALREHQIPLVVDLDGTLIKTDLLWESLARLLRRNPLMIFPVLFWWTRGRAFLKKKLAARVKIEPATLPYHDPFLKFLREQKQSGRKIILATASDLEMALPVANYVGLFDEVLASDGKTNLRRANKLKVLVEKFCERGFDYAGNSPDDLVVWRGAREAIVVNASHSLVKRAADGIKIGATFTENYSPFFTAQSFLNELFIRSGYLLAIVAGFLFAFAFPKFGIAGFAWVAPALLIFAAHGKNSGDAFRVGYLAGLVQWLVSLYWLLLMPVEGFPILGWMALCAFLALFSAVWVWLLAGKIGEGNWMRRTIWSLGGAAIWVALEMIRARLFGGFPWNFLGVSQFKMVPLIQMASVTGVYGVSFLVVWFSLALFSTGRAIFQKPATRFAWQTEIVLPMLAVVALFIFGFTKSSRESPSDSTLRVTLVQPSIPQTLIWDPAQDEKRFHDLLALSENALTNQTDLLVWPESAVPQLDETNYDAITNLVRTHQVWLIFNADDNEPKPNPTADNELDSYNAAFLFDPNGHCAAIYHKQKLVIFGEYVPLARWLPFLKWFTPIQGGYVAGNKPVTFEINRNAKSPREQVIELNNDSSATLPNPTVKTSPLICFEDTFPRLAREADSDDLDFFVNLTNDGWFGESAEQWQHMANAVFRAVENGIPLVCCANNGITCWINANGRVQKIFTDKNGSVYGRGDMTVQIPLPPENRAPTFYNRHGDWFGWSCTMAAAIIFLFRLKNNLQVSLNRRING
jgi:apolipoprotein N-acyltransferase